jgi:hypothetical protein
MMNALGINGSEIITQAGPLAFDLRAKKHQQSWHDLLALPFQFLWFL